MRIRQISEKIGVENEIIDINFGGKDHLYLKCISLFSKYDFISEIESAIIEKNYKLIENKAHALKGISANLGFKELFELSSKIVNDVREKTYDEIPCLFKYLKIEYERIVNILNYLEF